VRAQRGRGTVIAAALLLGLVDAVAGAERAVEITSPHFVVYSNAGETMARAMAVRAERVRATFARVWPWARVDAGAPISIFASNAAGLRAVLPPGTKRPEGSRAGTRMGPSVTTSSPGSISRTGTPR
jgi:hypothetical protein